MKGIKSRTATAVCPCHLLNDDFGIGEHVECAGPKFQSELQCFEKSDVLSNIIVLMADPFLDFDRTVRRTIDHHADASGTRVPQRSAIDVGNQIRHACDVCWNNNA